MDKLKQQWEQRQQELGNTSRAVLFKNLPAFFNDSLHQAHVRFLLTNLNRQSETLLDVGCGYGRTAMAIKQKLPHITFKGVELCEEFAKAFTENIGPCFNGSITAFQPDRQYDAITIVTLLMYLSPQEQHDALVKLWACLRPGGRIILIEPCLNLITRLRQKYRVQKLAPTGGEVCYFTRVHFEQLLSSAMPAASLLRIRYFGLPPLGFPALHIGAVLEKSL